MGDELDEILQRYQERQKAADESAEAAAHHRKDDHQAFDALMADVAVPVLERLAARLRAGDVNAVVTIEPNRPADGPPVDVQAVLFGLPGARGGPGLSIGLSIKKEPAFGTVRIDAVGLPPSGDRRAFADLTPELVEELAMEAIRQTLDNPDAGRR